MPDEVVQITFAVKKSIHDRIVTHLPHGTRKHIYRMLMDNLARLLEEDKVGTTTKLIMGSITMDELVEEG